MRSNFFVQKGGGILSPYIDTGSWFQRFFLFMFTPKIGEDEPIFEEYVFQLGSDYPPTSCDRWF